MFRKIRFRLADQRLWPELTLLFSPLWTSCLRWFSKLITTYPKVAFLAMVLPMVCSFILVLNDVFHPEKTKPTAQVFIGPAGVNGQVNNRMSPSLSDVSITAVKLRQNLLLAQHVDSLLKKPKLTRADSIWLMKVLEKESP